MSAVIDATGLATYRLLEYHPFQAAGTEFLYLVPSGAIFALEGTAREVIELLKHGEAPREVIIKTLVNRGHSRESIESTLAEMEEIADFVGEDQTGSDFYKTAARLYEEIAADFEGPSKDTAALDAFCDKAN